MTVLDDGNSTVVPVATVIDGPEDPFFDYGDGNQTLLTLKIFLCAFDVNASDYEGQNITYGLTGNGPMMNFQLIQEQESYHLIPLRIIKIHGRQ